MWITPVKADAPFNPTNSWLVGDLRTCHIPCGCGSVPSNRERDWSLDRWFLVAPTAVGGLAASFLVMGLFFHPWFIPIQMINAGLIIALLWLEWPSTALVGA